MSEKLYFTGIDLQQNQLKNAVIHTSATAPSNPVEGQIYYDTDTKKIMQYNGTAWENICADTLTVAADSQAFVSIVDGELHFSNLAITEVHVDTTHASLAAFIAASYTVGNEYQEGDMIILTAATDQTQRSWIHNGGTAANANDFTRLQTDLDVAAVKAAFSAGTGLDYLDGVFSVEAGGIGTTELANDAVTKDKIAADVAGNGLAQNADGSLEVKVDNASIVIMNDTLTVDCDVVGNQLAGKGLVHDEALCKLDVNTDNSTLEVVTDTVQVKDGGITQAKLSDALEAKVVNAKKEIFGNGTLTSFTMDHNLGTSDIFCHTWKLVGGKWQEVECQIQIESDNQITIGAFPAPASNSLKVLIQKAILE